jgi:hypothetical protein
MGDGDFCGVGFAAGIARGPEAIIAGSSPVTSEMISVSTRAGDAASASRPPGAEIAAALAVTEY